jgi:predicted DNA-binding WGR domain protein
VSIGLRKCDPARNQFRFYALSVQPNLFGAWSLIREWGRIGYGGQSRIELHDSLEAAERTMHQKVREKRRRGYEGD